MSKILKSVCFIFWLLLALSSLFGVEIPEQEASALKSIAYKKLDRGLEVEIVVEGNFIYQPLELKDPLGLAIDLSPVSQVLSSPQTEVNEFGVVSIRTAIFQPLIARVVFDFQEPFPSYEIFRSSKGLKVILKTEVKAAIAAPQAEERIPVVAKPTRPEVPPKEKVVGENFYNTMIGLSVGSYRISDERYQEVYPGSGPIFGLSLSRVLFSYQNLDFDVSLEARRFSKTGASTITLEESKFGVTPLSAAARVLLRTKYVIFFFGGGADHYSYKEESGLYPAPGYITGSATGTHIQSGIYVVFPGLNSLRVKLYFKSTRVLTMENEIEANLGGREFGVSLAYGFNLF